MHRLLPRILQFASAAGSAQHFLQVTKIVCVDSKRLCVDSCPGFSQFTSTTGWAQHFPQVTKTVCVDSCPEFFSLHRSVGRRNTSRRWPELFVLTQKGYVSTQLQSYSIETLKQHNFFFECLFCAWFESLESLKIIEYPRYETKTKTTKIIWQIPRS